LAEASRSKVRDTIHDAILKATGANNQTLQGQIAEQVLLAGKDGLLKTISSIGRELLDDVRNDGTLDIQSIESLIFEVLTDAGTTLDSLPATEHNMLAKACLANDLRHHRLTHRISIPDHPFRFEKDESIVWGFTNAIFWRDRVIQGSGGLRLEDGGLLIVTTQGMWFQGGHKVYHVKYKEMASVNGRNNGVLFCKGTLTARNVAFTIEDIDGWLLGYIVSILARSGSSLR
jgi:hypothetical protein